MRLRDHYDWVILGDHPGALLSASLVARLGMSVLVLPFGSSMKLKTSRTGQFLDPETNYLVGMGMGEGEPARPGLLAACLSYLGISPQESELIHAPDALAQVLSPQARLCLGPNAGIRGLEVEREFGRWVSERLGMVPALQCAESEFIEFWGKYPERLTIRPERKKVAKDPGSLSELGRRLSKKTSELRSDARGAAQAWLTEGKRVSELARALEKKELEEICSGLWYGATGAVVEDPSLLHLLQMLSLSRVSASFQGGLTAYRQLLLRLARRLGAHVPEKAECRRLFIEKGRFVGVQIAHHGSMLGASGGIVGCSLSDVAHYLSFSGRNWLRRLKPAPAPVGWRFTLSLTVHAEAIPPGMASRLIWQESGAPALEVEVRNPAEFGQRDPDHRILFVRTVLPFTQDSLDLKYQRLVAARMIRQVAELIPFLEFHVVRIYPDFRGEAATESSADELTEVYGFVSPDLIPENIRCFANHGVGSRTGIEGFFVATGESFPELGTLGATVAAVESVAWLAHRSGLPGPFV